MSSPIPLPLTGSTILGTHSRKRLTAVQDYLPGPMHVQNVDALAGAKIDRDQRTYMRSLLAAVPVGTRGSEWDRAHSASAHSSSQRTALLRGGSLQPLASSGGGTASTPLLGIHPSLAPSTPSLRSGRRPASTVENTYARKFSREGRNSEADDAIVSPRTLARAEERLLVYLATQKQPKSANGRSGEETTEESGLHQNVLRQIWDIPAKRVPLSPAPTAVPNDMLLSPLSQDEAIEVLSRSQPCTDLRREDVARLLRIGSRKLFPKYSHVMTEGLPGNMVYVVLRGRLRVFPSRIERQFFNQALEPEKRDTAMLSKGVGEETIGPCANFGILSALAPTVPRERDVVTEEPTELLVLSLEGLDQKLGRTNFYKAGEIFRHGLVAAFVETTLCRVNFFSTLPPLTIRLLAPLFGVRFFDAGVQIFEQGEAADQLYIILWGKVQVWRLKKRHAPRTFLAEYTGLSTYPWLGETIQWAKNNSRAGDADVLAPTLALTLHASNLPQFQLLCPGFKVLTRTVASQFTTQELRSQKAGGIKLDDDEYIPFRELPIAREPALRYAIKWVRIISRLMGLQGQDGLLGWKASAAAKLNQVELQRQNNLNWANEIIEQESTKTAVDDEDDESVAAFVPPSSTQALLLASHKQYGDSRTIAHYAAKKEWRANWSPVVQVRTEVLRLMSKRPGGIKGATEDGWVPSVECYSDPLLH